MLNIEILQCDARYAIAEFTLPDGVDISDVSVLLNGKTIAATGKISYIGGLKPQTDYTITVENDGRTASVRFTTDYEFVTLDVKKFGAKGDGVTDDTIYIQAAIAACPEHSRVLLPKGRYFVTNLFLKSNIKIEIVEGAEIIANSERFSHPVFPGMIESYNGDDEYNLGTWEGNPLKMFAGIITGIDVHDVIIYGGGVINGNATHNDWWYNEKVMVGAFRPRLLFLNRCRRVKVCGLSFRNSPSWTIHPYFSDDLVFTSLRINNPENSPNTDGIDIESCRNVKIEGVHFTLGDDCIALKSGKIYMGRKYGIPSENIHIRRCIMENGHGAVTLGSEMSAGIRNIVVEDCHFRNTDRGLRIKTRRGRGDMAVIDEIIFRNIHMDGVKTPFVANSFYFCDPDGRTAYVQDRKAYPVDESTPHIKKLEFENIRCDNCHIAAAFFIGLPERKIGEIVMKNIEISFAENAESGFPAMLCGIDEMSYRGIIAENVDKLVLDNVSISGYKGEMTELINVGM